MNYRKFYTVTKDIVSNYTTKNGTPIVYAKTDSLCLLVSRHDIVFIMESPGGNRFPVKREDIKRYFKQKGLSKFIHNRLKINP